MPTIIALLTDFGARDWYVASMKGVIAGICPEARVVDITHEIAPGDVRAAAYVLASAFRDFPEGTVFTAVVDPGVGSARRGLIAHCGGWWFIGPDNGLLSLCFERCAPATVRTLENRLYRREPVSSTFHGRDIFAPAAAHLANGGVPDTFGPRVSDWHALPVPVPTETGDTIDGEIAYIDRFGNAVTNIPSSRLVHRVGGSPTVMLRGHTAPVVDHYQAVPAGAPLAVAGSSGYVEISVNGGSAAHELGIAVGERVSLRRRPS